MFTTGVDVILDNIGASYFQRNLDSLNIDGRLFIIGFMGGAVTQANLASLLAKRLTVQGMYKNPLFIMALLFLSYKICTILSTSKVHPNSFVILFNNVFS